MGRDQRGAHPRRAALARSEVKPGSLLIPVLLVAAALVVLLVEILAGETFGLSETSALVIPLALAALAAVYYLALERARIKRRERELEGANEALARTQETLREQARTDALTGLANRRYFFESLVVEFHRARRHGRPLTLLMADLDFFKRVNDQYGHLHGDHVLAAVAEIMAGALRKEDVIARYGGEEFAVILPETDETAAGYVAEKLRDAVAVAEFSSQAGVSKLNLSVGLAGLDATMTEVDDLIQSADTALYAAKDAGRNRVVSAPRKKGVTGTRLPT
ncbi:MAG: diguanylate cyclase [Dehalococcoidia bacterium]|nr:diguanylate cyclase [Dehalococcoidia bacterium]